MIADGKLKEEQHVLLSILEFDNVTCNVIISVVFRYVLTYI